MVLLHEEHLRRFVHVWRMALANSVSLPATADPAYASLEALGRHVLSAAGGYMIWMCEMLALPDPGIHRAPDQAAIVGDAEDYMEHVLERWRTPLIEVSDERLETPEDSRAGRRATASIQCWNTLLCTPSATRSSWMNCLSIRAWSKVAQTTAGDTPAGRIGERKAPRSGVRAPLFCTRDVISDAARSTRAWA